MTRREGGERSRHKGRKGRGICREKHGGGKDEGENDTKEEREGGICKAREEHGGRQKKGGKGKEEELEGGEETGKNRDMCHMRIEIGEILGCVHIIAFYMGLTIDI